MRIECIFQLVSHCCCVYFPQPNKGTVGETVLQSATEIIHATNSQIYLLYVSYYRICLSSTVGHSLGMK